MHDDRSEEGDVEAPPIPEVWKFAKPQLLAGADGEDDENMIANTSGPKIGKLVKFLNDIEDPEELEARIQERDPSTDMTLLLWATVTGRFVLVEWLVKRAKRAAFGFSDETLHEISVFDKWIEIRKVVEEREKEKAAAKREAKLNGEEQEEEEEGEPEPTADQLVYEELSEFHDEWGPRGQGLVKQIGELGVYQGARDDDGAKTGLGRTLFPNNDIYTGEYKENNRDGKGTYYFADQGLIYTGDWQNNARHGIGRMIYADGARYLGAWAFDRKQGDGRYTYPDGSTYSGEWQADVKHGKGTYTFTDGSCYSGLFVDGEFVSGEWTQGQSGIRYSGSFANGVPTGKGVYALPNGSKQVGEYRGGKWTALANAPGDESAVLHVTLQNKRIPIHKSNECAGLSAEKLARVANFKPLLEWVASIEKERVFFVSNITLASATFDASGTPTSIRIKVKATDASGQHVKGLHDGIVLANPEQRLAVLLISGDKILAVVESKAALAHSTSSASGKDNLVLPTVRAIRSNNISGGSALAGTFIDTVVPALRLELPSGANTMPLPLLLNTATFTTNKATSVALYAQHVHGDLIATAASRLEAVSDALVKYQCVRLEDLASMTCDAATIVAARHLLREISLGRLPGATAAPQRPPTPLPPSIEPRPDIEPLLEAMRRREENQE
jgi:radial spoke head protein 1